MPVFIFLCYVERMFKYVGEIYSNNTAAINENYSQILTSHVNYGCFPFPNTRFPIRLYNISWKTLKTHSHFL